MHATPGRWWIVAAETLCVAMSPSTLAFHSLSNFIGASNDEFGWDLAQISLVATILNLTIVVSIGGWQMAYAAIGLIVWVVGIPVVYFLASFEI